MGVWVIEQRAIILSPTVRSPTVDHPSHGPLVRNVKLWVAHALGMQETLSPPPRVNDPNMHHGTGVTHAPWCMPGSLTSSSLCSWWRGKRSRHTRHMHNLQFYVNSNPYPEPVYTGWSSVHWNATGILGHWDTTGPPSEYLQGTLEHHWNNLVETAHTGMPLEKL